MMFLQKISILLAATSLLTHTINGDISEETGESQLIASTPDQSSKRCNGCEAHSTTNQPGGRQPDCLKVEWNGIDTDGECYESEDKCVNIKPCTFLGDVVVTNNCDFYVDANVDGYLVALGRYIRKGESRSFRINKGYDEDKPEEIKCGQGSVYPDNTDRFGWHLKIEVYKYIKVDEDWHQIRIAKFRMRCTKCSPNEYL
jgi:hypothetical protein